MGEEYQGLKYKVIMLGDQCPDHPLIPELIHWCGRFHDSGLAPAYPGGSYGNLSFRIKAGEEPFIITGTCIGLKDDLCSDHLVRVERADLQANTVYACGSRMPSSESMMHWAVYRERPEIMAVFHGHSPEILRHHSLLGLAVSGQEWPYGSTELAGCMAGLARSHDFFIAREHGFISLGKDMEQAGQMAFEILSKAQEQG